MLLTFEWEGVRGVAPDDLCAFHSLVSFPRVGSLLRKPWLLLSTFQGFAPAMASKSSRWCSNELSEAIIEERSSYESYSFCLYLTRPRLDGGASEPYEKSYSSGLFESRLVKSYGCINEDYYSSSHESSNILSMSTIAASLFLSASGPSYLFSSTISGNFTASLCASVVAILTSLTRFYC